MDVNEIIERIRQSKPQSMGKVPDQVAKRLLLACFAEIRASIGACEEGKIPVKGLGVFVVRKVTAGDKAGAKRIIFKAAKPVPQDKTKEENPGKSQA